MGNRFSRQHEGVEDIDASSNPYRYPPLSGKYLSPFSCTQQDLHTNDVLIITLFEFHPIGANLNVSSVGKSYFADYFLMGGSRFDTPQPEAYLFGENSDLNLLNPKPVSVSTCYAQVSA